MADTDISNDKQKYLDYSIELRNQGYGCAQCVLMALAPKIGLDERSAARMAAAYNSGFAGSGGICGAISILGLAEGLLIDGYGPEDKAKAIWNTKALLEKFEAANNGRSLCRELKGKEDTKKCPDLIKEGVKIFLDAHPDLKDKKKKGLFAEIRDALKS